jgi:hypothetical protein
MIVDLCPGWACDRGNVDFSMPALEAATGFEWDRKPITWDFVECDTNLAGIDAKDTDTIAMQSTHVLDDIQDVVNIIQNGPVQIGI